MASRGSRDITSLLQAWHQGEQAALAELAPVVERELRRLARMHLSRERDGHTLEPPDLVNEAFVLLMDGGGNISWQDRAHFYAVAGRIMRRILIQHARRKQANKRRGWRVSLERAGNVASGPEADDVELLALHEALEGLERIDARKARVVELRFFAGLDNVAIAEVLGISIATVKRDWQMARAWLHRCIADGEPPA